MNEQIDKIEAHIDHTWDQLAIFNFPKYLALYKTLASFEYLLEFSIERTLSLYGYESRPSEITHLRQGFQCLIPKLFEKCPDIFFNPKETIHLREMRISFQESLDAIRFSQAYDWISYHFTGYRQKWYDCQVKGRYVQFVRKADNDLSQGLLHHQIKVVQDEKTRADIISNLHDDYSKEEIIDRIKSIANRFRYEELLNNVPSELYEFIKYCRTATSSQPSIGNDIKIAGYTINDCYVYWMCFSTVLSFYVECCKFKSIKDHDIFLNSLVLSLTPLNISSIISRYSGLSLETTSSITRDMILDTGQQRPDVQIQPFIPINANYLYVSPLLFITSNWEVCLLRRWAKKYPDEYGKFVASTKVKLSHNLALTVDTVHNIVAENQVIIDQLGHVIAEVDLAVYNKENRNLFISEIKWVIEADSFQEDSHVQQDLRKGIEQIKKIQSYIAKDASIFISNLFPKKGILISDIAQIQYALISKGGIDCGINTKDFNIEVLDYQLTVDHLKTNGHKPFNIQIGEVIELHDKMKSIITAKFEYNEIDLAGFRFATPGFDKRGERNPSQNIPQGYKPKDLCYCGSGKRYSDCCQIINKSLSEEKKGN